ncbi:polysaccharide deacetylase family protein [Methanosarcina sp. T3]|uniref:polysaccharide deacetylase family protein n=1 Tax=Methanosarcina sp. T3 TaxID=3439062 RepID=UPI003F873F89
MFISIETRDFTSHKFLRLCEAISSNYPTITMAEYMEKEHPECFVLMRHDIDRMPERALVTARIEHELGIKSTYYFRTVKNVLKPEIIKQIKSMGHEIGYHYETLSEAKGDHKKALALFQSNLEKLREMCEIKTICMHGKPLSKHDNRELWKNYDFRDFGVTGEAYLSVKDDLNYFSDTGRTWGHRNSIRDCIPGKTERVFAETTDELIELIEKKELNNFYILVHPERWPSSLLGWGLYYSTDMSVNLGKKILIKWREKNRNFRVTSKNKMLSKNKMSITVDVEDWYHIPSVCGSSFSVYKDVNEFFKKWNDRYDYLSEPTRKTLDLLDEFNITATFFIVADVVKRYPGLIESISEKGHEIACHGADHRCVVDTKTKEPLIDVEEFEVTTLKAKKLLERTSGQEVIGYRAPNGAVTGWMLDSLEKIGFKYDSSVSVNSLYNKSDSSLRHVSSFPYYPASGSLEPSSEKRNFVEFPWAYYDVGIKIPTYGGPTLRFLGSHLIFRGLKQSLNRGDTIFYFHPIDISREKFPPIGNRRPFYWTIKGKIVEERLRYVFKEIENINKVPLKNQARSYFEI